MVPEPGGDAPELDGVTKRNATYLVKNCTGKKMKTLTVYHKYSDNYRHKHSWDNIPDNGSTSTASVEYNTGAFTTGRDWWLITWLDEDNKFYLTDPNNLRGFMDFMERFSKEWLKGMANEISKPSDVHGSDGFVRLAIGISAAIFVPMLNSESTKGFKQHILREEDTKKTTEIIIKKIGDSNPVKFQSKSGDSVTVYREGNIEELLKRVKEFS